MNKTSRTITKNPDLHLQAIKVFRKLHETGCFIVPNPWDAGSAKFLESIGFKALATTSAGFGFSRGKPDIVGAISRDESLANIREIVFATSLPVNADFQHGYANSPEGIGRNVLSCIETGVAGLSIEDATGNENQPLYERGLAVERIRAARRVIDDFGLPVVLTARCEAWLVGDANPFKTSMNRLVAYAEAGADCLFAPGIREPNQISDLVKEVHPKSVNVIVSSSNSELSFSQLSDLGVRRVSVGSALARIAWAEFMKVSRGIAETGSFTSLGNAATFSEINNILTRKTPATGASKT